MSNALVKRDAHGRLLPGSQLNSGGRPAGLIGDVRERLGPYTPAFVAALVELARSSDETVRLAAIHEFFDRLLGKPAVAVAVDNSVSHQALYLSALIACNQKSQLIEATQTEEQEGAKGATPSATEW
jgi:hypothetical protein